ncbi:hypothetical protein M8J77_007620 [Diaphorina citri]|nr:hypothetical protein M8J77_007620 [Diaphorina citri]
MIQFPIQAFCRIKPPTNRDIQIPYEIVYSNENKIILNHQVFIFDNIFGPNDSNETIFTEVLVPLINHMFNGINATLLAYGQTGGGKTYTVSAMIMKTLQHVMQRCNKDDVYMSYLQLYSEKCYDLLNGNKEVTLKNWIFNIPQSDQRVQGPPDPQTGPASPGNGRSAASLTVKKLDSLNSAVQLIVTGNENKVTAVTKMNAQSSRSHTICTIYLGAMAKLHLVDLAGSEQLFSLSDNYLLRNEARKINLSLHYLEQVMIALDEPNRHHIPYRNSTLTSILKDSLGGNGITSMIAVVSMDRYNQHQTLATLKFAQRTLRVSNYLQDNNVKGEGDQMKNDLHPSRNPLLYNIYHPNRIKENTLFQREIEKLEAKVKLRDKEIGVLLEMLTEYELNNFLKDRNESNTENINNIANVSNIGNIMSNQDVGSRSNQDAFDDFVMFTNIDELFQITDNDSFILSNFKIFSSSEDGSEVSTTTSSPGRKTFPNGQKNTIVSTAETMSSSASNFSGDKTDSFQKEMFTKDHRHEKENDSKEKKMLEKLPHRSQKEPEMRTEVSARRSNRVFDFSNKTTHENIVMNRTNRATFKSRGTQQNSFDYGNQRTYNALNFHSNTGLTNNLDERPNKTILRKTENKQPKLNSPRANLHVTFVGLNDSDEKFSIAPLKNTKQSERAIDQGHFVRHTSHNSCKPDSQDKRSQNSTSTDKAEITPIDRRKYRSKSNKEADSDLKENGHMDARTNNRAKEIHETNNKELKDNNKEPKDNTNQPKETQRGKKYLNEVCEATDPSIVENIEQYLTGDDLIDEEIVQFYARRAESMFFVCFLYFVSPHNDFPSSMTF